MYLNNSSNATPLNVGCFESACSNDVARGLLTGLLPTTPMKGDVCRWLDRFFTSNGVPDAQ